MTESRDLAPAKLRVGLARHGGIGHDQGDPPSAAHVEQRRAHIEVTRKVLLRRDLAADPKPGRPALLTEALLKISAHVAIGHPGRVANHDIRFLRFAGKPDGPGQISRDVAPDVVAAFILEAAHDYVGIAENAAIFGSRVCLPRQPSRERGVRFRPSGEVDHGVKHAVEEASVRRYGRGEAERCRSEALERRLGRRYRRHKNF